MRKKDSKGRSRIPFRFSEAMEMRLLTYTTTAVAAGVTAMALTEPSQAEVVYTHVNENLFANSGILDLNNDGVADFRFIFYSTQDNTSFCVDRGALYYVRPVQGNAVRGSSSALPSAILVGRNPQKFRVPGEGVIAGWGATTCRGSTTWQHFYQTFGNFANQPSRYLGLQFLINGETHYGWARLHVTVDARRRGMQATLTGYAYETTPNAPIFTGTEFGNESKSDLGASPSTETKGGQRMDSDATLGRLAQGAQGLATWRKSSP